MIDWGGVVADAEDDPSGEEKVLGRRDRAHREAIELLGAEDADLGQIASEAVIETKKCPAPLNRGVTVATLLMCPARPAL
jgi:hypothetical protein